ncbi:MAG: isochorismatase family protein [Alphaproteobacteria bacterium]|nr:isochorismatase family protein [Alphaproteobacteria bacterium]
MSDAQATLESLLPISPKPVELGPGAVGLVVVDAGVAFTREGALADPVRMVPMVRRIAQTWRRLDASLGERLHTLCFLDTHHADIPEPPYPPHGVIGTGEEAIDPELGWLPEQPRVQVVRKDCINGFVGAIDRATGRNAFCEWVIAQNIRTLVVTGDCTDICVSDFVVAALSARNHGLLTDADPDAERARYVSEITGLRIVVYVDGCETFHAPGFHDRDAAHHVGLWLMASRGARLASALTL